jgi:hypothetical protein
MKYLQQYIEEELDHYRLQAKGLHQYGKTLAGQMDFERVIVLKLAKEALEARLNNSDGKTGKRSSGVC